MPDFNIKYRPQKVAELDSISAREEITKILLSGKIPHAFLFAGPRGVGKTSAARILAKAVNCLNREKGSIEPCNTCPQCLSITAGNNLDVLEIDAASNRGIDDIRDLREKIKLAPSSSKFKVYIIDEVHMLTTEAFNALLKTLEEPPSHAIFILCTTAPEKLPETIVSRCLRFNIKRASQNEIEEKLNKIVKSEKIEIEDEALSEIARAVTGSFRDGNKVLEQLSMANNKITKEMVQETLGQMVGQSPDKLLKLLVEKKSTLALKEIENIVELGGNVRVFNEQLLILLHHCLLEKLGVGDEPVVQEGLSLTIEEIKKLIAVFSRSAADLKDSVIPQLPLELAVIEWCGDNGGSSSRSPSDPTSIEKKQLKEEPQKEETIKSDPVNNPVEELVPVSKIGFSLLLGDILSRWQDILIGVRPKNHSVEALLRSSKPVEVQGNNLYLEVFYQFHKDKLESPKCRQILEGTLLEIFGLPINVRCVLGDKSKIVEAKIVDEPTAERKETVSEDEEIIKAAEQIFSGVAR